MEKLRVRRKMMEENSLTADAENCLEGMASVIREQHRTAPKVIAWQKR